MTTDHILYQWQPYLNLGQMPRKDMKESMKQLA